MGTLAKVGPSFTPLVQWVEGAMMSAFGESRIELIVKHRHHTNTTEIKEMMF